MYETSPATVTAEARDDLRRRIQRTRRLGNPWGGDRSRGIPTAELDALLEHWGGDTTGASTRRGSGRSPGRCQGRAVARSARSIGARQTRRHRP